MRKIFAALAMLCFSLSLCNAQNQINPASQVRWPAVAGAVDPAPPTWPCAAANYGQPYTNTATGKLFVCAASGWVSSSTGALNPGLQSQLVQYPANGGVGGPTSLTTDATGKNLTVPGALAANLTNGSINSDMFSTGNNGVSNAFASPLCSGPCTVIEPSNSTDTVYNGQPSSGHRLIDYRSNSIRTSVADPLRVGGTCVGSMAAFCDSVWFTAPSLYADQDQYLRLQNATFSSPGWNYGNSPNAVNPLWSVQHTNQIVSNYNTRGITQDYGVSSTKHAVGDFAIWYVYGYCDGGQPDYSGEGCTGYSQRSGQSSDYFHGTVGSGATTGMTSLPILYNAGITTVNRNATTDGSYMLDISKGTISGHFAGPASFFGFGDVWSVPVDNTLTPSTAYGAMGCELPEPNPILTPVSVTCNIVSIGGSNAGGFVVGQPTIIGGDFPEQVNITAVGAISGGTQSVTFTYLHPHGQSITSLWQGGPAGQFLSYDLNLSINGFRQIMHVYGAIDSSHLAMEAWRGTNTPPVAYFAPVAFTSLVKSGTTLTGSFDGGHLHALYFYNKMANAVIAGCSDASLNGNISNVVVDTVNYTITATQTAGGTGCPNATIQPPASYYSYHLFPGAEVRSPSLAAPGNATLEPNYVAWAPGDTLEEPLHPFFSTTDIWTTHTVNSTLDQNSSASGVNHTFIGSGIAGSYKPFTLDITTPCANYAGCGGVLAPVPFASFLGPNNGGVYMDTAPLNDSALVTVLCPAGGCGTAHRYKLFSLQNGTGQIYWDSTYNEMNGTSFNAGGGYVAGAQGIFTASLTVAGQNVCQANGTNCPAAAAVPKGRATLVAGTVTVSTAAAGTSATYTLTNCGASGTAIGTLSVGTVTAGTSFVINSLTATNTVATGDTSTVCWIIQ